MARMRHTGRRAVLALALAALLSVPAAEAHHGWSSYNTQVPLYLEGIVANPDQPVGSLPMLTEDERRRMLLQWNDNGADGDPSGLDDLSDEDLDSLLADLSSQEDTTDE